MLKKVDIYTDGACLGNPGAGGWAAVLEYRGTSKRLSGGEKLTTNNRMELTAVIMGLEALTEACAVTVHSDSKYVVEAIEKGWARSWKARGWIKSDRKPALNSDLWDKLLVLLDKHRVDFVWLKGHAGHPQNELCDVLAVAAAKSFSE